MSPEILQSWLALIVATVSIGIAFYGVKLQHRNILLSVRPLPYISCADYENLLWVKIRNDGVGPLLIKAVHFNREEAIDEFADLVSYMPKLPPGLFWSKFSSGLVRTVPLGGDLPLLEFALDPAKPTQARFRDRCRAELQRIEVIVEYTDMHGSAFVPVSRNLDWFKRRLAISRAS